MSHSPSRILVVMPAYNEEEAVADVVREVFATVPGVGVLVVDDGSSDATSRRAAEAGATVLRLPINLGVGGAMRAGFKYALQYGYDTVIQVDSDGQHDPRSIPELVSALETHDVVMGARFAGVGDYRVSGPRHWAMVVLSAVLSRIAKTRLTDTTSGFRASGPRAVRLFAVHYPSEYLGDTIESLVIAQRAGLSIAQVPVAMRPRAGGVPSHNPYKAAVYLGRAGMALFVALIRPRLPLSATVAEPSVNAPA
ncbi:glycosyl transferase family 2 [Cnuibacter physcomitrellae]|uniref:Glycosyl transferase family 2 n=1 Tax=Cnuibacter physcomitrellae TaxID=1619308 RepID=A0A1X9LLA4_9MICO|nr:glycosyltransferase family 2 protein [Cnuibacter physcomitrellae]ARJ05986.1 glycosyl transferase family 2 [Cnuibacter physcomitrellae]MCS5496264.1 glycosyltransferase family 2 protein [Cnuibacter physcomitrellae]GGI36948.1 glycosyl transferase family 2 [Cnuibacter physcomitrellae]